MGEYIRVKGKDGIVECLISEEGTNKMINKDYSLHIKYFDLCNQNYLDYFKLDIVRFPEKDRFGLDLSLTYSDMLLDLLNASKDLYKQRAIKQLEKDHNEVIDLFDNPAVDMEGRLINPLFLYFDTAKELSTARMVGLFTDYEIRAALDMLNNEIVLLFATYEEPKLKGVLSTSHIDD